RDLVVGRNRQKLRSELFAFADIDGYQGVGKAGLLEEDGELVAVGGRPVVEADHGRLQGMLPAYNLDNDSAQGKLSRWCRRCFPGSDGGGSRPARRPSGGWACTPGILLQ